MIIQLCGMSGAGKSTIAHAVQILAGKNNIPVTIIDGDKYRRTLCRDLGFSKEDRTENIRRLTEVAFSHAIQGQVAIISAIHPYASVRSALKQQYPDIKTVFIDCPVAALVKRDTKGLYKRAFLPDDHPDKIHNLTGINDPFDRPVCPDLHLRTDQNSIEECTTQFYSFIRHTLEKQNML